MTYDQARSKLAEFGHRCNAKIKAREHYNGTAIDFFAKFSAVGRECGHHQETLGSLRHQVAEKHFRLVSLLNAPTLDFDAVDDTIQDLVNYSSYLAIYLEHHKA